MRQNNYIKSSQQETDSFTKPHSQDFLKVLNRLVDKWYMFAGGLIIALSVAVIINKFSHPMYRGNTTLLIRSEQNKPIGAEALIRDISFDAHDNIRNQIGILKSYSLAKRTLETLDLEISYNKIPRFLRKIRMNALSRAVYHNSPIVVQPQPDTPQLPGVPFYIRIISPQKYLLEFSTIVNNKKIAQTDTFRFEQPIKSSYFSFSVHLRNKYSPKLTDKSSDIYTHDYSFMFHDIKKLAAEYSNNLKVDFYFDDASILELSLEDKHPGIVADFLNSHAKTFIESGLEEKNRTANATIEFIDRQISGISDSLQEAESDFQEFRSQNRLINISSEGNYAMEKLESLIAQKSNYQRMIKYYDYLYDYIQNKDEFQDVIVPSTMGITDQSLNNLVKQLSDAYTARSRLRMTTTENSPQIKQINNEIETIHSALVENVRNIINTTRIELEEINQQIEEVNREIQRLPGTERKYINIQRDFQLNDNIYTFLLQKRSEAGIALASNISDHKIIDPAMVQNIRQTTPRPMANIVIAAILGLLLPGLGLIVGDSLNTRITSRYLVEENTTLPVLGHIEHNTYNETLPVILHSSSPLAESFRALRTNIDFMIGKENMPPVIALTSSVSGEGKSFCSANLGAILAITGKKILVVGMDLRKPQTHREFKVDNKAGLSNYLLGTASFHDIVIPAGVQNLSVVTSGPIPPNPAELLQSGKMTDFLNTAKEHFDVIILDTPPLALVSDTLLITGMTSLNIFVIRQGHTRKQAIDFLNHLYEKGRINKTGILVNDVKTPDGYSSISRYGYGYGYSRFRKSGYYS